jgi:hypothetical protein
MSVNFSLVVKILTLLIKMHSTNILLLIMCTTTQIRFKVKITLKKCDCVKLFTSV